jgi:hypothetical protein
MRVVYSLTALSILAILLLVNSITGLNCRNESDFPHCDDKNVWNGYWWQDTVWIESYPSIGSWFTPAPVLSKGNVVFYGPGIMEANADIRNLSLEGYIDGIALMSPADIGLPVWLKRPGHEWEGPYLVVDCAGRSDMPAIVKYRREIAEVSWDTAVRWGMVKGNRVLHWRIEDVEVSKIDPRYLKDETVIDYPEWLLNQINRADPFDPYQWRTPVYRTPSTWLIDGQWVTFRSPQPAHELLNIR